MVACYGAAMTPATRLAFVALLLSACPADDAPPAESSGSDSSGSDSSGTGPAVTTALTTTSADTTEGPATTADPSTTSGSSSSSSSRGDSSSGSDSTGGEPPVGGYGDCANPPMECELYEACLFSGEVGVCSGQGCGDAGDCPISELPPAAPPSPTPATVECVDVTGRGQTDCILDCSVGLTNACPEGMTCLGLGPTAVCLWPVAPDGGGACPDIDLGSRVPQTVMGTTVGLADDHYSLCGYGAGAEDGQYQFTALAGGTYTFDTIGSGFDTVLAVLDSCGDFGELGCGDDQFGSQSGVTLDLVAGQSVVIVVDGYQGASGPFVLNISQGAAIVGGDDPDLVLAKQHN